MLKQVTDYSKLLCEALGYDMNTVEFAVKDGVPYAIDFMNPAPDAEASSVGQENFDWIVETLAKFAIDEARKGKRPMESSLWSSMLGEDR
jgi:hypothetical protein